MSIFSIESEGDANWFKINLTSGTTYSFQTTGLDASGQFEVYANSDGADEGTRVQSTSGGALSQTVTFTADTTGVYDLEVFEFSNFTGPYTLSAAIVPNSYTLANPGALAVGGSVTASIQSEGDTNWFAINLTAGTTYSFTATGLDSSATLNVYAASDASDVDIPVRTTAGASTPQVVTFTADATGVYDVAVFDTSAFTGSYTLSDAVVPDSYTLAHPGALTVGGSVNASIESAGDTNWFAITLTAGTTYKFTVAGLDASAAFAIFSASEAADVGNPVDTVSTGSGSQVVTFTADATGVYDVQVSDSSTFTGAYTLSDTVVADSYTLANPGALTVGGSVSASIQSAGDANWFAISLTAGTTYTFNTTGMDATGDLAIFAASAAADVAIPVDSVQMGPGTETLTFTADASGVYDVEVFDTSTFNARYTLTDTIVPNSYTLANPGALTVGGSVTASIQSEGDTNWFAINLTAGTTYTFQATGLDSSAQLEVYAQSNAADAGVLVDFTSAGSRTQTVTFTADTTGVYDVEVYDFSNFTGAYTLSDAVVPDSYTLATPGALTLGSGLETGNLYGEGLSDVLLENTAGAVVVGQLSSSAESYLQVGALGPEWTISEIGDFLGTGSDQFLMENTSGAVVLGTTGSTGSTTYDLISGLGPEWSFEGAGNFFGDGKDEYVIENTSGAVYVGEVGTTGQVAYTQIGSLGPEWSFEGVGDFLGTGKDQILIENTSGVVVVGQVGANDSLSYTEVAGLGPEWKFEGVGDFLGDGQDQFLIENTSGAVVVGQVGANNQATYSLVGALGSEWKFIGAGDYSGSGIDSFLIESSVSGAVVTGTITNGQAVYSEVSGLGSIWSVKT
jgi:hypothetical protein